MLIKRKIRDFKISYFNIFVIIFIVIKLILMGLFSSDYQNNLFMPFVMDFLNNGGNPYQRFYEMGILNAFPYPPIMLWIQCIGGFIIKLYGINNLFWQSFIFKIPSFVIDLIGLYVLNKFFVDKRRYIAVFYFASPIVIYSVYMHGQLDLVPMIMITIAMYYLI